MQAKKVAPAPQRRQRFPSFLSLLSKVVGSKYQGTVQGFASSSGSLASIIGLILGGFLYEVLGGSTFLVAGLVIYTAFIFNFRLRRLDKNVRYKKIKDIA